MSDRILSRIKRDGGYPASPHTGIEGGKSMLTVSDLFCGAGGSRRARSARRPDHHRRRTGVPMSPARHPRSVVHPRWLRVPYGWMAVIAFILLCSATVWGQAFWAMGLVLFMAWLGWRGERDCGHH